MKRIVCTIMLLISFITLLGQQDKNAGQVKDGPYIFKVGDSFSAVWIRDDEMSVEFIMPSDFKEYKSLFGFSFSYRDLDYPFIRRMNYNQRYKRADSICVLSDIHGYYYRYINLLKAMSVIGDDLSWKFGKGHLVILGDIFDRGEMVTEILWHLFGLEKQARKAGGRVHILMGNHEQMILSYDLRYINEKYRETEKITETSYTDLYSENTVLGRWIRSFPAAITIKDILFLHAGASTDLVRRELEIKDINKLFYNGIIGKDIDTILQDEKLEFLSQENGPLWYRGYFMEDGYEESKADSILSFYRKNHIVVGHTSVKGIRTFFNNKIIGVDAGIMYDQPGEALIIKNGIFYRGMPDGSLLKF